MSNICQHQQALMKPQPSGGLAGRLRMTFASEKTSLSHSPHVPHTQYFGSTLRAAQSTFRTFRNVTSDSSPTVFQSPNDVRDFRLIFVIAQTGLQLKLQNLGLFPDKDTPFLIALELCNIELRSVPQDALFNEKWDSPRADR
eukprot:742302-Pyramimonas_sp.AAC.1